MVPDGFREEVQTVYGVQVVFLLPEDGKQVLDLRKLETVTELWSGETQRVRFEQVDGVLIARNADPLYTYVVVQPEQRVLFVSAMSVRIPSNTRICVERSGNLRSAFVTITIPE